jgi:excisionase family DNA binding protein
MHDHSSEGSRQHVLERAFGTAEVAQAIGCSERTVRRWIRAGFLPERRPSGGRYRILETDIAKLLARKAS